MKQWIRPSWAAGTAGKRQVVLAGMLVSMLVGGVSHLTWMTQRPPLRYVITLEAQDKKGHYFTTLAVASPNPVQAGLLARSAAQNEGIRIVGVEDITPKGPAPRSRRASILKAEWAKVYFPTEHKCQHAPAQKPAPQHKHSGKCAHDHEHEAARS